MYRYLINSLSIFFVSLSRDSTFRFLLGKNIRFDIHVYDRSLHVTNEDVQTMSFIKKNRHEMFSLSLLFHPSKRILLRGNSPSLLDLDCAMSSSRYHRRISKALSLIFESKVPTEINNTILDNHSIDIHFNVSDRIVMNNVSTSRLVF